ncbi:hypothetical protein [Trueperella pyogenes]
MVMVLAPIRRKSQAKSDQRRRREAEREARKAEQARRAKEQSAADNPVETVEN